MFVCLNLPPAAGLDGRLVASTILKKEEGIIMLSAKNWRLLAFLLVLLGLAFGLAAPLNVQARTLQAPGDLHVISGVVRDGTPGGHTWPLYARIDIAGYSGSPIHTNPVTGAYSVDLQEGTAYDFTVSAVQPGYQAVTQTVTVPTGDLEVNFDLQIEPVFCEAQGYTLVDHWSEKFDGVTAPALPSNWASADITSYNDDDWITRNMVEVNGLTFAAQSNSNVAYFSESLAISRLYHILPIDMTTLQNGYLTFWMFHSGGYPNSDEFAQVQVSTDNGQSWLDIGAEFHFFTDKTGWAKHAVDLSAYATQSALLLGIKADTSNGWSGAVYIDTISLGATCEPVSGTLLTGQTLDDNSGAPLNGVKVESSLDEIFSQATPLDDTLGDGFYSVFAPAGDAVLLAASKIPYQPLVEPLDLPAEALVAHDFLLKIGMIEPNPGEITQTLLINTTATQTLYLNNTGGANADFILSEINRSLDMSASLSIELASLDQPAAGEVLSSFSSGLELSWGLAYNPFTDDFWIQDRQDVISRTTIDDRLVRFHSDGTSTGDVILLNPITNIESDLTFNPLTNSLWQPGLDACIYEFDLNRRAATGNSICIGSGSPGLGAVVFDPVTNTYIGSRIDTNVMNASLIYRFSPQGQILESATVNVLIRGIAYNPANGHLFVTDGGNMIYVLDVNNNYGVVQEIFGNPPVYNFLIGIDFDCDGSLWAVSPGFQATVYEIASGETGVCDWMEIPWLSETPLEGQITAEDGSQAITLTFDSNGLEAGIYEGTLHVETETNADIDIPVTLIVIRDEKNIYLPLIRK
jgi:hypothetical protein